MLAAAQDSPLHDAQLEQALRALLSAVARASAQSDLDPGVLALVGYERVELSGLPSRLRAALAPFSDTVDLKLSGEPERRDTLELCEWIDALLDDRSDRQTMLMRFVPRIVFAVLLVTLVAALFSNKNLAYGKSVVASSLCSLTPPERHGKERLSRVTDGVILEGPGVGSEWGETNFALCTRAEEHPWVTVDLGSERTLNRFVVYNRSDCCWNGDDLPLSAQVSLDGTKFDTVATTDKPFTTEFPWSVSVEPVRARYVRLYVAARAKKSIVLSEFEVYGH